jgi:glycosyltransferase involved in cell wall biosynthesis
MNSSSHQLLEGVFGNPGSARNAGCEMANGDWIAFWDADDVVNPRAIESLIEDSESNGARIAIGNFKVIQENCEDKTFPLSNGDPAEISKMPGIWRFIFKREVIKDIEFPPLRMGEDQIFLLRSKIYDQKIEIGKASTYSYFKGNQGQLTTEQDSVSDLKQVREFTKEMATSFRGKNRNLAIRFLIRQTLSLRKYVGRDQGSLLQILKITITHPIISIDEFIGIAGSKFHG